MKLVNLTKSDKDRYQAVSLQDKISLSESIIKRSLDKYSSEDMVVAWTGGKDSTVLLWLLFQICRQERIKLPRALFINEGDVFPEVESFVDEIAKKWEVLVHKVKNEDVSSKAKLGGIISVSSLNSDNQQALKEIGWEKTNFKFESESFIGNHLMKTVPLNTYIKDHQLKAVLTGVRWDEHPARAEDDYVTLKTNPTHDRVEPILHFSEADIWELIQEYGIPYLSLYEQGYRSLGAKSTTQKVGDQPAWKQDLEKTKERAGRKQDKEKIMKDLRDLGYM